MHSSAPAPSSASSSPVQHQLSSHQQYISNNSPPSMNQNTSIPTAFASFSRDTTPVPSTASRTGTNNIATPPLGAVAVPASPSVSKALSSTSSVISTQATQARSGSTARRPIGSTEAPIDLRGLSILPAGNASAAVVAATPGACRQINLPTLKNPQGELLDLSELAGFSDGLTPTQETFSISTAPASHSQSPLLPNNVCSPTFAYTSAYQSPALCISSPGSLSSVPSQSSLPSLSSMTSIPSSVSSLSSLQSPSSQQDSPSLGTENTRSGSDFKTPNVYINGLPPNFPEDELLAMTKPFGEVISVRTFTRHVSDKPSGYGFVLFGSVDAAEKCIESLRKYRNLHPSFSKQIHKIPGTSYAAVHADTAATAPHPSTENPDSFKVKMEKLKDTASTNLYMEGLPLSIDEETLQVLVDPYKIMSSRFFRTRLSNPPRIIAFVRLESRQAAEDIIDRLHGRMVRGWCDSGSRISVRFADTSDQRELRRVERTNRDGENSPARLTMAQAALLNLKGTQLGSRLPSPNFGVVRLPPVVPPLVEPAFVATQTGSIKPLPPPIGLHHQQLVDPPTLRALHTTAPYGDGVALGVGSVHPHPTVAMEHGSGGLGLRAPYTGAGATDAELLQMQIASMNNGIPGMAAAAVTRAQNGFTPMERMILQAREQLQQREAQLAATSVMLGHSSVANVPPRYNAGQRPSDFNPTATEFNPNPITSLGRLKAPTTSTAAGSDRKRLMDFIPSMSEKEFHARGQQQQPQSAMAPKVNVPASLSQMDLPGSMMSKPLKLDYDSRVQFTRQRNQTHAEAKAQAQAEADARARSTTMPSHYGIHSSSSTVMNTNTVAAPQNMTKTVNHYDSGDSVVSSSDSVGSVIESNVNANVVRNLTSAHRHGSSNTDISIQPNIDGSTITNNIRGNAAGITSETNVSSLAQHLQASSQQSTRIDTTAATTVHSRHTTSRSAMSSHDGDDEEDGSGLDSPALSYSARTPASLSPATPFSAFGETFEGPSMAKGHDVGLGVGVSDVQVVGAPPMAKQNHAQPPSSKLNTGPLSVGSGAGAGIADR